TARRRPRWDRHRPMKHRWALVLSALLAGSCVPRPVPAAEARGLTARVTVSNVVGLAPLKVIVTTIVLDPKRELACPEYTWDYDDGSISRRLPDCDPDELEGERPERYAPAPREYTYRFPGTYMLLFTVRSRGVVRTA